MRDGLTGGCREGIPGHASLLASEEAVNQMAPMAMSLMEAGYLKHHGRNIYDIYDGHIRDIYIHTLHPGKPQAWHPCTYSNPTHLYLEP